MGNKLLRPNQDSPLDGFNDDQLTYLADKFEVLKNDKGFLDLKNFCQFFKCSQDEGQKILKFIDNEGNGQIDFYEFKCAAASLHQDDQEAQRMIHQIYSNNSQIKPEQFYQFYKTIFLYLKDFGLLKQTQEYRESFAEAKLKQYDYNKNGFLDLKQFSQMLGNDFHCKLWMTTLGFKNQNNDILNRVQKPQNDAEDFQEEEATGDQAGSTPAWIKTIDYMAPVNPKVPSNHNQTPSSNLDIQYVYGYRSYDTRDNLKYNSKGEAVYHTAALGIVLNQSKNTMKLMDLHNDDITCLDSKDNITVTGQMGKKPLIVVWNNQTMEKIAQFSTPLQHSIACIAISPSKKYLAASSMSDKHQIAIFDIQNKKLLATGNGPRSVIYALRFNANQDMVAASCAKQVVFAQFKNNKFKLTKGVFGKISICASFSIASYGGGVVSGMQNGTILVWKGTSCSKPYKQHTSAVTALCETDKGGLVSGDVNGNIFIWSNSLSIEKKMLINKLLKSPSNNPKVIALSMKGNNLLIGTRGGQVIQVDVSKSPATGNIIMQGHFDKQLWGVASASKSNEFFTGGQDKLLIKWDIIKRKLAIKNKCQYQIMSVDYNSKSNVLAVGMKNGIIQFYNANSLKKMDSKITLHKNPDKQVLSIVKYSPDCSLLAVGYCPPVSKVYFYSTSNNKKVAQCKGCISRITCIDFTKDSSNIMINNTSYEILFFSTNGQQITSAKQFKSNNYNDDDFETLSCKYSWQAQGIWPHLYADGTNINAVERSHDRKYLATGDDFSKIKLYNYPACVQKQLYNTSRGHSSHITGIKWSYDDQYMISIGGLQKSVIQWKLDKQEDVNYQYEQQKQDQDEQYVSQNQEYQFQGEPQSEVGKQKSKVKDDDDDFEEQDNQGDQALAVKPFLGQVISSTPSEYLKIATQTYNILPQESLKINYAWGIRNQYISDEVRNQLKYSQKGNSCIYFTAALGVEMNLQDQSQTFYNQQSQDLISMSITNDRKIVATGQMAEVDKSNKKIPKVNIHIWNVDTKQEVKQLKGFHQRAIVILQFSPDGTQLLSIGQDDSNTLAVYNWKNGKITWSAPTSKGKATGACWKNNKQYCTIGTDHIKFWTQAKGVMGKVPGKWEPMYSVAFLDGAKYVSGGSSGNLFFWNGGSATKIQGHKGKVHTIKVNNIKTVYSGAEDGNIIVWKYNGNQLSKQSTIADLTNISQSPGILSIDIHPKQERMLVCTKSSQIYQFPINKFQNNTCQMKSHFAGQLWTCVFSPDNLKILTGGDDKTIRVYDIGTYKQLQLANTKNIIRAVDWCQINSNLIVAGDWKGLIYLFDSKLQQLDIGKTRFSKMKPMKSTYWIQDIKFSPDGKNVAFGAHGGRSHVEVFQINGNKFGSSKVLNVGFTSALLSLDWNINSDVIVAVSQAYEFKFINLNGDPKQADLKASAMKNQKWASWSNKFGWMVKEIFQQPQYFSIHSVCRDQSQSLIATGGTDQKLKIFKYPVLAPKQKFKQYIGHSSHITRVKFSHDQDYLISTGGNDRTTILWQVIRPNKAKKIKYQKEEEEEEDEEQIQHTSDKQNDDDDQTNLSQKNFDDDIDIPRGAVQQKQQKQQVEDQGEFEQEENEGDQFMAILPFKGALVAPTLSYKQNSGKAPKVKIQIQYAYGYRTKDCRNNLKFINSNKISYHTAALGVIMDISSQPQQQQFFNKHTDDILSMCWSSDKQSMFTGQQGPKCLIHEWNTSGDLIKTYKGMIKGTVALACNDKYLAAAGMDDDHIIIVYDRKSGAKYATQKGGKQFIVALQFVNQNTFVSVGIKHYKLWTIQKNKLTATKGSFKTNNNLLTCAKVHKDKILAGAGDGTLQIWTGTSIKETKKLHGGKPLQAICCLQNIILTGGKDKKINIINSKYELLQTLNCQQLLQKSVSSQIRSIDVLEDRLLVGTISSQIYQLKCSDNINQATSQSKFELIKCYMTGHYAANAKWTNEVWGLSLMQKDDEFVTCSDDSTVRVWNMKKRQQTIIQQLDLDKNNKPILKNKITGDFEQSAKGRCVAVSQDKYVLVGCKQGTLRIFNPKLKQIDILKITNKQISDIKFSPDNKYVAIGAHDSKIYIYEWNNNGKLKKVSTMKGHHSTITHIDFSQDGNYIHSNSRDYQLLFWETNSGKQLTSGATMLRDQFFHTWTSCIGWPVEGIWQKFSKGTDINAVDRTKQQNPYSGETLLCVGDDFGKVRLLQYPVRTKNSQSVDGSGHSSHVTCVRFDKNDKRIISTGGQDQTIIQWKITR